MIINENGNSTSESPNCDVQLFDMSTSYTHNGNGNNLNGTRSGNGNGNGIDGLSVRSYNKWAPSQQGSTLVWRDVSVYAKCQMKRNKITLKRIINNSSGAIQPGTLMAVMGSSGSGKSTLMSALACRNAPNTIVHGDILLNGRRVGPFMHRLSGFVHQEDLFYSGLTVLEHMTFMAHLKLDRRITKLQKSKLIKDLMNGAGLAKSVNTAIGKNDGSNVLSGGERKRLAFATELLTQPTILFCDEPTTGLDSFSAQQLVGTLQQLARRGTTIMCTIHQPSSQLFAMFQQVLLLNEGRVAFMGVPEQALDFFAENGYTCPESYNPADFIIDVLAKAPGHETACQKSVNRLCDLFAVSKAAEQRDLLVNLEIHMAENGEFAESYEEKFFQKPLWPVTLYWLIYRNLLCICRDPTVQFLKMFQKVIIALMIGLCVSGSLNLTQQGIQGIQGTVFVIISENTFSPMYSVLSVFPQGFPLFMREKRSGLYNTVQYYISHIVAMVPGLILEPILFVIACYWIAGMRASFYAFIMTSLVTIMVLCVSTSCGCLFSTAFNSVPLAMAYLVPFDYVLMITSGAFIKLTSISPYLAWMKFLSWIMYANESLSIIQWEGVVNITCYENNVDKLPCLSSGAEVLDLYSFSEENFSRNIWSMLILFIGFNSLAWFFLWKRSRLLC